MAMLAKRYGPRLGQFGHTFKRTFTEEDVVKTVEQRSHDSQANEKLWRNISLFVALPLVALSSIDCWIKHKNHPRERMEYKEYAHLKIMNKPFPWGDGKHSLFHNPKTNWIPGVGYEEDDD